MEFFRAKHILLSVASLVPSAVCVGWSAQEFIEEAKAKVQPFNKRGVFPKDVAEAIGQELELVFDRVAAYSL